MPPCCSKQEGGSQGGEAGLPVWSIDGVTLPYPAINIPDNYAYFIPHNGTLNASEFMQVQTLTNPLSASCRHV